ncbi:uncharacterized protein BT62DRAFT_250410 [Guyanagaster necrorhizus]|uniref:Uncharacterized protein n=1 Tax=Guyanagaster necrorhizus TaxID=856835 RepID=A0A9P7VQA6_9AGAR|nr:uncharacterized protein BT62DRAFT_250410 [Guyanagaster necrorhizus MCA 3950]KAG7444071.1 hypothetical protein BT62DRAFT_250410 [Guyanagaster necrorhizus MCA 3950]
MTMEDILSSSEICQEILKYISGQRRGYPKDLLALCQTNKAWQRESEKALYHSVRVDSLARLKQFCTTIITQPRIAELVIAFSLMSQPTRYTPPSTTYLAELWKSFHGVLQKLPNLLSLAIAEQYAVPSWVFSSEAAGECLFPFNLTSLTMYGVPYNSQMAEFICAQSDLQRLQYYADPTEEDVRHAYEPGTPSLYDGILLEDLRELSGNVTIVHDILSAPCQPPITRLIMGTDEEWPTLLQVLPKLSKIRNTLRNLGVTHIPHDPAVVDQVLDIIAATCPDIRTLGLIPLPWLDRSVLHRTLMQMQKLISIELVIHSGIWNPIPQSMITKVFASELKMYCPSLMSVSLMAPSFVHR